MLIPYVNNLALVNDDIFHFRLEDPILEAMRFLNLIDSSSYNYLKIFNEDSKHDFINSFINATNKSLIEDHIKKVIYNFIDKNSIKRNDLLELDFYNIIVKNSLPRVTDIGGIKFNLTNQFDNFVNINSIRLYLKIDMLGTKVEIRGLGKRVIELHRNFMLDIIIQAITILNSSGTQPALDYIREISRKYNNRELPVEYYRALTPLSSYIFNGEYSKYEIFEANEKDKMSLDISHNENILKMLFRICLDFN